MTVITGSKGGVYIAAQNGVAATGEAMTDGGLHTVYTITNAAKRYWDDTATVTVKKNGVTQSSTLYTVQYVGGKITFLSAILNTDVVTVDITYLPITQVAQAFNWNLTAEYNLANSNVFGDTWEASTATLGKWSGTFDLFWNDSTFFIPTAKMVVSLHVDHANDKRYEGFARISQDNPSNDENALTQDKVGFTGMGQLYNVST